MPEEPLQVAPPPESPYKGLIPYSEQDAAFFFGRDRERQIIATNLLASRLTVLYGQSGVGKTSVLRAGVVHDLLEQARAGLAERGIPGFIVVEFATWRDDPMVGLPVAIEASVRAVLGDRTPAPPRAGTRLDDLLQAWAESLDSELLLIFDQFEEFFLYHGSEDGDGTFATEFARAVNRRDLRANFMVAIREDTLAKLDRFKGKIPNQLLFGNYLTVNHLDRAAGREAILRPIDEYNRSHPAWPNFAVEPALVERVLREVEQGQLAVGQVGAGTVAEAGADEPGGAEARIETPYLQLVMSRLWDEEQAAGSTVLQVATLERLGGAERIVRTHLDDAMSELSPEAQDLAARVFRFLVTPGGTKIALSTDDLSEFAGVPAASLEPLLDTLARRPALVLRPVAPSPGETTTRYEIFHDVLAAAILDWRARYQESRRRVEAEEQLAREREDSRVQIARAHRRVRQLAAGGIAVAAVTVFAVFLAFTAVEQRNQADRARADADVARAAADQAKTTAEQQRTVADQARATAEQEKTAADAARATAEQQKAAADEAKAEAEQAKAAADQANAAAQEQKTAATAAADVAQAMSALAGDPQLSLHYALEAVGLVPTSSSAEDAVRMALSRSRLRAVERDHTDVVWTAAFSPDGTRIVTASNDHTARIADSTTGQTIVVLTGHTKAVTGAAFTPDGRRVVTVSDDETARVWDAASGRQLYVLNHDDFVHLARSDLMAPGAKYVATGAFSADGRYVVTSAGSSAWIWDLGTGRLVKKLVHSSDLFIYTASFSANGASVVTAADDGLARIWDVKTGKVRFELDNDTAWMDMATFSPDGKLVACANEDGSVGIWNATNGKFMEYRTDHSGEVKTVAFSSDGKQLVTAGEKTAYVLSIKSNPTEDDASDLITTIQTHASWIDSAEFSPNGRYVVTANQDGTARVFDLASGDELFDLRGHTNIVWTASFSPQGNRIVTASEDHTARVWAVDTGVGLHGHTNAVNAVAFSPDGTLVATASLDETASIWNARTGRELQRLEGEHSQVALYGFGSARFTPDGRKLLTAQEAGGVAFWDVSSGDQIGTCCERSGWWAESADFLLGREDRVIVQYEDSEVHVWDTGQDPAGLDLHTFDEGSVYAFAVARDGRTFVTVGRNDKMARVWAADDLHQLGAWHLDLVNSIGLSPDGSRVISADKDGVVRVWDAVTGAPILQLGATPSPVMVAVYSVDGSRILGGLANGTTRIWASDGHLLADLPFQTNSINALDSAADGRIAVASDDRSAKIFTCQICGPAAEVIEQARSQAAIFDPSVAANR